MIDQYLNEKYSWLDVGAGAGTFAKHLQDKVDSIECTELDPSLINECRKLGFTTYEEDFLNLEISKKYDVVSAWHVLEHVENIESFLEKMSKLVLKHCIIEIPLLV